MCVGRMLKLGRRMVIQMEICRLFAGLRFRALNFGSTFYKIRINNTPKASHGLK